MDIKIVQDKVWENTLHTCEYIEGFVNTSSTIMVRCKEHDLIFSTKYENVRRDNRKHHICPECKKNDKDLRFTEQRAEQVCDYCGEKYFVALSKAGRSKSGFNFCCREHKDLAQRIDSGDKFASLRPEHYNNGEKNYREVAMRTLENKCDCCGWDEDVRILEVHHVDSNRNNNSIDNLAILCPTCHRKITLGYYSYDRENHKLNKL